MPREAIPPNAILISVVCLITLIARGHALGAASPEVAARHWAFQPASTIQPPAIRGVQKARTPIDRFLLSKLEKEGLNLSEPVGRATLLRRASFTLTGLPPLPEDIEAFLKDRAPDAFERRVETMLGSARYGERWGRHWLDVAGYADSNGYFNADTDRPLAYRYRDYVIRSIARDDPFDRFIREQIAGDELTGWAPGQPADDRVVELLEATHFLRNGQDGSGESDGNPDEVRADRYYALESAMQIIGSSLLGLTVQCAKCHDHKFEPFSQKDYYGLQAVLYPAFNIEKWVKPNDRFVHAYKPGELEAWQAEDDAIGREERRLREAFTSWVSSHRLRGKTVFRDDFDPARPLSERWSNTAPGDDAPGGKPPVTLDSDQGPGAVVKEGRLQIVEGGGSGDRWISTRQSFSWRPGNTGDWIQVTFDLVADRLPGASSGAERVAYFIATRDFDGNGSQRGGNLLIDGNPGGATSVHLEYPRAGSKGLGSVGKTGYRPGHNYGVRLTRVNATELSMEHLMDGAVDGKPLTVAASDLPDGGFGFEYCCSRSFIVDNVVIEASAMEDPAWAEKSRLFQKELEDRSSKLEPELKRIESRRRPKPGRISWMTDLGSEAPEVRLLKRGDHTSPGDRVAPAFPAFLNRGGEPLAPAKSARTTGSRRRWAEWITEQGSPQAGLLARVTMNRMWQHYFGTGLVSTPDNLGVSGSPPSNRELLDWLAAEFIRSGWSMKAMHRLMTKSAAFQQSSAPKPVGIAKDPSDRWLWRYPMRRLDADAIRDATLAVGGKLDLEHAAGPYVPTARSGSGEVVVDETVPGAFARSIFLQQRRTKVPTLLGLFDAPSVVFNCSRRAETTMPLQSLSLLNSDFSVKRAEDFASRVARDAGADVERRIQRAFLLAVGAVPTRSQSRLTAKFLESQRAVYAATPDPDRRAWNDLCQMILASNSFLYLE
ncbi:MAG: DUF1549 domain-containing protein [Verrucomicrobia bacterium]|nr:DUF1549 domain-containing protein [Verrucomicrobiota bacterium]